MGLIENLPCLKIPQVVTHGAGPMVRETSSGIFI